MVRGRIPLRGLFGIVVAALALGFCANAAAVGGPGVTYSTSVTADPNPVGVGQTVTLTATATASDGSDPDAVEFTSSPDSYNGNCTNQPVTLVDGQYEATCVTSFVQAGSESITATVVGEFNNTTATPLSLDVQTAPTTITVARPATPPVVGSPVEYVASITASSGGEPEPPTGTVDFLDGGAPITGCQKLATATGSGSTRTEATCSVTYQAAGAHSITASYSGDQFYAPSSSPAVAVTVGTGGNGQRAVCPDQDTPVSRLGLTRARAAVLCLVNKIRARYGDAALGDSAGLDSWAQAHPDGSLPPGLHPVLGGTVNGEGITTPYGFLASAMRVKGSCQALLLPMTDAGLGVVERPVLGGVPLPGTAEIGESPTWTLMLFAATSSPGSLTAVNSCPHPLPIDGSGQGRVPAKPPVAPIGVSRHGSSVTTVFGCSNRRGCRMTVQMTLPGAGAHATGRTRRLSLAYGVTDVSFPANAAALARELSVRLPVVNWLIKLSKPTAAIYLYERRLISDSQTTRTSSASAGSG